jgi:hypothetical protein
VPDDLSADAFPGRKILVLDLLRLEPARWIVLLRRLHVPDDESGFTQNAIAMMEVDVHAAAAALRAAIHHRARRRKARRENLLIHLKASEVREMMLVQRVGDVGVLFGHGGEN